MRKSTRKKVRYQGARKKKDKTAAIGVRDGGVGKKHEIHPKYNENRSGKEIFQHPHVSTDPTHHFDGKYQRNSITTSSNRHQSEGAKMTKNTFYPFPSAIMTFRRHFGEQNQSKHMPNHEYQGRTCRK
jgi:hypothetical protein